MRHDWVEIRCHASYRIRGFLGQQRTVAECLMVELRAIEPMLDCVVPMTILQELTDEVGETFLKVHQELSDLPADDG